MKTPKALSAALPGPAVLFVGEWLDLFTEVGLASPEWQVGAHKAALAIGAFVSVALSMLLRDSDVRLLKRSGWALFGLTIAALLGCWAIWFHLGPPPPGGLATANPAWWRDIWRVVYVVAMVLLVTTLTVASLTLEKKNSAVFWVVAAVSALLVVAGILFFFLR
jgi:hypothetical protein